MVFTLFCILQMKPTGTVQPFSSSLSLSFFFVLCILSIVEARLQPLSQSLSISHQAHSFDDLGEWRQLIAKGSNFIKVDFRYTVAELCAKQARVLNHDNRGCYLLTHDMPLENVTYYTSHDLVAFVIDPDNQYLFPNISKFYIYIDFKNNRDRYPPANITQSDNLQKEYMTFFTNTLRSHNWTHIDLVYNGVYLDERNKSYNWPRTYQFADIDIDNPNSCLYSYKGLCKNKTIINNMANPLPFVDPALSVYRMCDVGYGKFSQSNYPMVFYEPTDQKTILGLLDAYLQCGFEHKPGFTVSINIDPVQYDVYAGTRSGKAWNQRLYNESKWAHAVPISSNGTSMSFVTLYLTQENKIVYSFATGALDVVSKKEIYPFGNITVGQPHLLSSRFSTSPYHKLKTFSFFSAGIHFLFVSDTRGVSAVFSIEGSQLKPVVEFTLAHAQSATVAFVESSIVKDDDFQIGWVQVDFLQGFSSYKDEQCSFWVQWWRLRFDVSGSILPELTPVGEATCGVYSPRNIPVPADSASLVISPLSLSDSLFVCPSDSSHAGLLIISSHKNIYGGVVCVNIETKIVKICTDKNCSITQQDLKDQNSFSPLSSSSSFSSFHPPTIADLDVGTFPSLSLSSLPSGEIVVLEVHGDGFCYNSDWNNKKSVPTVCSIIPVSSRYVLNYNYGKLKEWANHIYQQPKVKITSCDGSIYHGTYDEGSLPSAFLFLDKQNKMRMVEAHTGFPTGAIDYAGCSWPVSFDGSLIDGITLPDVNKMIGGKWNPGNEIMKKVTPGNNYENNVYSPEGKISLSDTICALCQERFFKWQVRFQNDYELMHTISHTISNLCTFGQLFIGDGTVAGCKNLVLLYLPALAVDMSKNIFSPDNCQMIGVCDGNATSLLPDINSQVARSIDYLKEETDTNNNNINFNDNDNEEEREEFISSDLPSNTAQNNADVITTAIRNALKTEMLKLIGL